MSERSDELSLLALVRLYDQLLQRVESLEEQVGQTQDEGDGLHGTYLDGKPIRGA